MSIYSSDPLLPVPHPGVSWEYPGSTLGVSWEYPGSTPGVSWEYPGSTLVISWEYPLGISWEVLCREYTGDILGVPLEVPWEYPVYLPTQESSWDGLKRVSGDFLTWNAGVSI